MGGGGGYYSGTSSSEYKEKIKESLKKTYDNKFETKISGKIDEALKDFNNRDVNAVQNHLNDIKSAVDEDIDGSVDLIYGGSVKKHTYVDGLSDVDVLMRIDKTELANLSPKEVLNYIKRRIIEKNVKGVEEIKTGKLAVTVKFKDGTEVQVLPAIKRGEGYKIAKADSNEWSNVVRPQKFAEKLTVVNQKCNNKVVPTIKLVKSINSQLPEEQKLTGYHIESIAIEVFKNYTKNSENSCTPKAMLKYYFKHAPEIIKSKIKDKTGQSLHVDDYLGQNNSERRYRASYACDRVYRKIETADEHKSEEKWNELIGE
jgi:hypothetical protein